MKTWKDIEEIKRKRNADLVRVFKGGAPVSSLCSIYTLDERVVCQIIREHMANTEREKEEEKGKKRRAVPHYRKNVAGSRDDVLTKGGFFDD